MAETLDFRIPRAELSRVFRDSPRMVRLFEALLEVAGDSLPVQVANLTARADEQDVVLSVTQTTAQAASTTAALALAEATEGPPPVPPPAPQDQDDLRAQIGALHDRIAALEKALSNIHEGPTP